MDSLKLWKKGKGGYLLSQVSKEEPGAAKIRWGGCGKDKKTQKGKEKQEIYKKHSCCKFGVFR